MTLEEFYKATKDMPMDTEIWKITITPQGIFSAPATGIECLMEGNIINIC